LSGDVKRDRKKGKGRSARGLARTDSPHRGGRSRIREEKDGVRNEGWGIFLVVVVGRRPPKKNESQDTREVLDKSHAQLGRRLTKARWKD